MSLQNLENLIDEGKRVTFYLSPSSKARYVCEIDDRKDEEHMVYADTVVELLHKLERKEFSGI